MKNEETAGRAELHPIGDIEIEGFESATGNPAVEVRIRGMASMRMAPITALHVCARLGVAAAAAERGLTGTIEAGPGDLVLFGGTAEYALAARLARDPDRLPPEQKPETP